MMRKRTGTAKEAGFTLIELLIAIVIVGVALTLAAPSMRDFIEMQRLKSVNSEMVTDLQFARSEAVARGHLVGLKFGSDVTQTCYVVAAFTGTGACPSDPLGTCDCTRGAGAACAVGSPWVEVKTATLQRSKGVQVMPTPPVPPAPPQTPFGFDPTSGNLAYCTLNSVGVPAQSFLVDTLGDRRGLLRTVLSGTGRPSTCAIAGSVPGIAPC